MYMYISITYSVLLRYGMHESFDYYINCRLRKRNRGLFYADRVRKPCHKFFIIILSPLLLSPFHYICRTLLTGTMPGLRVRIRMVIVVAMSAQKRETITHTGIQPHGGTLLYLQMIPHAA